MSEVKSPFKFLDPFTLADRDAFFGRDKEIAELYRLVFKTPLLIVYGLSGTGKTSLVQCGLASRFDGPDWLPVWIRRRQNINHSLASALDDKLTALKGNAVALQDAENDARTPTQTAGLKAPETPDQTPSGKIRELYKVCLRPVFLIFDQFEELFIFGEKDERGQFVDSLKTILNAGLACNIVIVVREEYLGQLYPFEKAIPSFFDFRMRVEPMVYDNVCKVLSKSFRRFNISVEAPTAARYDEIVENVRSKSGIELPYLQVYLDRFYREDFTRTYPDQDSPLGETWMPVEFTRQEIADFGKIDAVLDRFLTERVGELTALLKKNYPSAPDEAVRLTADAFVSDEGTKRPIRFRRQSDLISIDDAQKSFFPVLDPAALTFILDRFKEARLIRDENDSLELAHDSLAALIEKRRTAEERRRTDIKRQIRSSYTNFDRTNEYLTRKQLNVFEDDLPHLNLESDLLEFVKKSKDFRADEEMKEKQKERRRLNWAIAAAIAGLCLAAFSGRQYYLAQRESNDLTKKSAELIKEKNVAVQSDSLKKIALDKADLATLAALKSDSAALIAKKNALLQRDSATHEREVAIASESKAKLSLMDLKKAEAAKLEIEINKYITAANRMKDLGDVKMARQILLQGQQLDKNNPTLIAKLKEIANQ